MGLDSRYVLAPSLEMYFVNKDTGLPLENGQVFFYEDDARTVPKDVFQLSGAPPNYSYNVLPNPSSLSAVGTFQDNNNNDILPYYYPFDAAGNVQLYYIEVYDNAGVLQFTREGWPNFTVSDVSTDNDVTNFVPNGQFLLHDNIPASTANTFVAGKVSQDVTVIAEGGWSFERGPASTATDFVTFPRYGSAITNPTGNPRYAVQIQTTIAGSDVRKDLCLKFRDVNTFASDTQNYNFYFEGQSVTGSDITNCQIIIRKFFGAGGSTTTETVVTSITLLASSVSQYNIPILFGTNSGKSIGTGDDDYVQIIVRLPPTSVQNALMTDFALTVNDEVLTSFPEQTNAEQIDISTAGWLPAPDYNGNDLYCPTVLGPSGLIFDHSSIGEIVSLMVPNGSQTGNLLYCDGSAYLSVDYSALGIPYARLKNVLFNASVNGPLFGTGVNFANANISTGNTSQIVLVTNKVGVQTNPADSGTGFVFNTSVNAGTTTINYNARSNAAGHITAVSTNTATVSTGVSAGTSTFVVANLAQTGVASTYYAFSVIPIAAAGLVSGGGGGTGFYFDFSSNSTNYRMWFRVIAETAPAAGGRTLIQCNLVQTMTVYDVAVVVAARISSFQTNTITVNAAPDPSDYFTFSANSVVYNVWYQVNGVGTAPTAAFAQLVPVVLTGAETNAQVASKTASAINGQYFAVPDLRGYFLRGYDPTELIDIDDVQRYANYANSLGVGTYEVDAFTRHSHGWKTNVTQNGAGTNIAIGDAAQPGNYTFITQEGGNDTRPVNAAVNFFIRY